MRRIENKYFGLQTSIYENIGNPRRWPLANGNPEGPACWKWSSKNLLFFLCKIHFATHKFIICGQKHDKKMGSTLTFFWRLPLLSRFLAAVLADVQCTLNRLSFAPFLKFWEAALDWKFLSIPFGAASHTRKATCGNGMISAKAAIETFLKSSVKFSASTSAFVIVRRGCFLRKLCNRCIAIFHYRFHHCTVAHPCTAIFWPHGTACISRYFDNWTWKFHTTATVQIWII